MMSPIERHQHLLHSRLSTFTRQVTRSRDVVAHALDQMTHPYIAFSTGKDSVVAAHLVWAYRPDVPGVYFDADCAFPESYDLLDRLEASGRTILRWKTEPMLDTFARLGGPDAPGIERATMESTVYAPLRALLQEQGYDGVFLGLRSQESEGRTATARYHGSLYRYARDGVLRCLPVASWSHRDIWAYIVSQELDYNHVYDRMGMLPEADRRVSYWAGETKRRHGRFVFLKEHYPDLFNRYAARFPEVRTFV